MSAESIITGSGIKALQNASASDSTIKPAYYMVSEEAAELTLDLTTIPNPWKQAPITAYLPLDQKTIQFTIDISFTEATGYGALFGLFLEDGTLFAAAVPPYPFPPQFRQIFHIQITYQNAGALMDCTALPYDQVEQDASGLESYVQNAAGLLKVAQKVTLLEEKQRYLLDRRNNLAEVLSQTQAQKNLDIYFTRKRYQYDRSRLLTYLYTGFFQQTMQAVKLPLEDTDTISSWAELPGLLVAITKKNTIIYSSSPLTWTKAENPAGVTFLQFLCTFQDSIYLIANGPALYKTQNGTTWEKIFTFTESFTPSTFFASGSYMIIHSLKESIVYTSENGTEWTKQTLGLDKTITENATLGSPLIHIFRDTLIFTYYYYIVTHPADNFDLSSGWTIHTIDLPYFSLMAIASSSSVCMFAGYPPGYIFRTESGTAWTTFPVKNLEETSFQCGSMHYTGDLFIMGATSLAVALSPEGKEWTTFTLSPSLDFSTIDTKKTEIRDLTFFKGRYIFSLNRPYILVSILFPEEYHES